MRNILIFFAICLSHGFVTAQNALTVFPLSGQNNFIQIAKEVRDINNQELYKAYIIRDENYSNITASNIDTLARDGYDIPHVDYIYYDMSGCIRKIILSSEYGFLIGTTSYYNKQGFLFYSINFDVYEGVSYSSISYLENGEIILKEGSVYLDQKEKPCYFELKDGIFTETEQDYIPVHYQSMIIPSGKNYLFHTDSLKNTLLPAELKMPQNCKKVIFKEPEAKETTRVNSYDVTVRTAPFINAKIIDTIYQQGTPVYIKNKFYPPKKSKTRVYPWYEIEYISNLDSSKRVGYIYGACIEPIEKYVKSNNADIRIKGTEFGKELAKGATKK